MKFFFSQKFSKLFYTKVKVLRALITTKAIRTRVFWETYLVYCVWFSLEQRPSTSQSGGMPVLIVPGQRGRSAWREDRLSSPAPMNRNMHIIKPRLADTPQHDTHTNPKLNSHPCMCACMCVCVIPADAISSCWNLNMKHRLLLLIKH